MQASLKYLIDISRVVELTNKNDDELTENDDIKKENAL
jgi:hypothetical protein